MVVVILEKTPPSLKGEVSRWLSEVAHNVFVGCLTALVRDLLWESIRGKIAGGGCTMLYSSKNEQGFDVLQAGITGREAIDLDGVTLIRKLNSR
jgi:CRISPR-associated protein Cas2